MYIDSEGNEVEVTFEDLQMDLLERDPEERMEVYFTEGVDSEGNIYSAIATFICDELDTIDEIDFVEHHMEKQWRKEYDDQKEKDEVYPELKGLTGEDLRRALYKLKYGVDHG